MLKNIYNQRVTILNRLKRSDNDSGKDLWYKSVVEDVAWYTKSARSAGGSTVFIGTYITVLFPFNNKYLNYLKWKDSSTKEAFFTMSAGDYIILGDVTEDIDADNIVKTLEKYGENVCQVRHKTECYSRYGAFVQLKIEGV